MREREREIDRVVSVNKRERGQRVSVSEREGAIGRAGNRKREKEI